MKYQKILIITSLLLFLLPNIFAEENGEATSTSIANQKSALTLVQDIENPKYKSKDLSIDAFEISLPVIYPLFDGVGITGNVHYGKWSSGLTFVRGLNIPSYIGFAFWENLESDINLDFALGFEQRYFFDDNLYAGAFLGYEWWSITETAEDEYASNIKLIVFPGYIYRPVPFFFLDVQLLIQSNALVVSFSDTTTKARPFTFIPNVSLGVRFDRGSNNKR